VSDAGTDAVADRTRRPQGAPAAQDGVEHIIGAEDVQVRVLLARERCVGEVLGGGRRADGDGPVTEGCQGCTDGGDDGGGDRGGLERRADQG
jgi:hypothetical protein